MKIQSKLILGLMSFIITGCNNSSVPLINNTVNPAIQSQSEILNVSNSNFKKVTLAEYNKFFPEPKKGMKLKYSLYNRSVDGSPVIIPVKLNRLAAMTRFNNIFKSFYVNKNSIVQNRPLKYHHII